MTEGIRQVSQAFKVQTAFEKLSEKSQRIPSESVKQQKHGAAQTVRL